MSNELKLRLAAYYSVFVGVSMLAFWAVFFATNQISGMFTESIRILLHIFAELIAAVILIISGIRLLRNPGKGKMLYVFGMGMLIYTLIQSPSYFAQRGSDAFIIMFTVFLVLAVYFLNVVIRLNSKTR